VPEEASVYSGCPDARDGGGAAGGGVRDAEKWDNYGDRMNLNGIVIAGLLLSIAIFPLGSAELLQSQTEDGKILFSNGSYWIKWDPIGDHIVGDPLVISGTTNLSAGSTIYYEIFAPTGGCHTKICNRKPAGTHGEIQIPFGDTHGITKFSTTINNTTGWQSSSYYIWFLVTSPKGSAESDAFTNSERFVIYPEMLLFPDEILVTTGSDSLTQSHTMETHYWISFPVSENFTKPCYLLQGRTNLPIGQKISYSYYDGNGYPSDRVPEGIVVPGDSPGINRLVVRINASEIEYASGIIVWNPRYNYSDRSDSISFTTDIVYPTTDLNSTVFCPVSETGNSPVNSSSTTKPAASPSSILVVCSGGICAGVIALKLRKKGDW
jgi:hypothetical protein